MTNVHTESPAGRNQADKEERKISSNLFMSIPQGVIYQSADGAIISANPAAERILGLSLSQMQSLTAKDLLLRALHEDGSELPESEHPSMQALTTGQPVLNTILEIFNPVENRHLWLSVDAVPESCAGEDRPSQVYVTFSDITERKMADEALRQSEERFRLTFQASPDAININRLIDGMYVDINPGFTSLTGYSRADVIGRKSTDLDIWHDLRDRRKLVKGLQENGHVNGLEAKFRRKDGRICHGRMSARVILLEGVPHISSITRDMTDHMEALEALRAGENMLSSIFRTAPTAIGVVSNRIFITVNDRICTMTGYSKEELVGKNSRMLYLNDMEYEFVGKEKYEKIKEFGTGTVETRWQRKDGETIDILMSSSPINPDDLTAGVTFTALDISERNRDEAEREKLHAQLLQAHKMESVGRLAGGIAHDFNNMLGVILGHTEMIMCTTDPALPVFTDLQEIRKAAERSANLTGQLLAFARKQTITPKVLDLNEIVEGMLKLLYRLIGENIELVWLPGRKLSPVKMDPSQIDQILANLSVNARDAIAGIGRITIETECVVIDEAYRTTHCEAAPGEYVLLAVSDNGCGMDRDILDKLFDPFFTTKELGQGTGLGLAVIHGIVRQNNGFICVYSEPGQGTTFKIYLPRYHGKAVQKHRKAPADLDGRGRGTILLVEDEASILKMTQLMLEQLGYTVLPAPSPTAAIGLAREHAGGIDVMMTDVVMPEMNGRDLANIVTGMQPGLKCLFTSGYTDNIIAHHGVLDEGMDFIQKPFAMKDLAAKIQNVLDRNSELLLNENYP